MQTNGIIGDDFGTTLPEMKLPEQDLSEERNAARFSKTAEFKKLKEHLESRIEFYKTQLPDGRPVTAVDTTERAQQWVVANAIIAEFRMVIDAYETAAEVVKNA